MACRAGLPLTEPGARSGILDIAQPEDSRDAPQRVRDDARRRKCR
jgi:hypothetical protein